MPQAIERILPDSGFIKGGDTPSAADIVIFDLGIMGWGWLCTSADLRNVFARIETFGIRLVSCRRHQYFARYQRARR